MRLFFILIISVFLLSCNSKSNDKINVTEIEENNIYNTINVNDDDIRFNIQNNLTNISQNNNEFIYETSENEENNSYGAVIYNTIITNDVNVYLLPDFNSRKKDELSVNTSVQVIGISGNNNSLKDNEYWINIYYGVEHGFGGDPKTGWILSSFTDIERCYISYIEVYFDIKKRYVDRWGNIVFDGKYFLDNSVIEFTVNAKKLENQNFFSFNWDYTEKGFHYTNIPGLYILNEAENKLQHISYAGGQGGKWGFSAWSIVTDDFKYLLQDQGTGPETRAVIIWNLEDGEEIISLSYDMDINLNGHTIEIVKYYGGYIFYSEKWSINDSLTEEEIIYVNNFLEENEPPDQSSQGYFYGYSILIIYEYNIITQEKKINRAKNIQG